MADRPTRERVEAIRGRSMLDRGHLDLLAEIDALRSDLATARRDALNEAAEELAADAYRPWGETVAWLRDRARAEEGR